MKTEEAVATPDASSIITGPRVTLELLAAGYCRNPEWLTLRGGRLRSVDFPAGFALIRHPQHGLILFDTGYSARFHAQTRRFPARLYAWTTPVVYREADAASAQLRERGIDPADVAYVVLSHLHADHVAGLADFPQARIMAKREAYDAMRGLSPLAAVRAAFLPGLLPEEAEWQRRLLPIEAAARYALPTGFAFPVGYDLFGDGSLVAVDLPGHARGQVGLLLATSTGETLLCADAVWSSRAFREGRRPHPLARLIMDDADAYAETFARLCRLHREWPQLRIVPSHCMEALRSGGVQQAAADVKAGVSLSESSSPGVSPGPGAAASISTVNRERDGENGEV